MESRWSQNEVGLIESICRACGRSSQTTLKGGGLGRQIKIIISYPFSHHIGRWHACGRSPCVLPANDAIEYVIIVDDLLKASVTLRP